MHMKNIAVTGAGKMGNGIDNIFVKNGFKESIIDVNSEQWEKE